MKIDIAVENENAHFRFDKPTINFPFVFTFIDRISKTLIEVNLDLDTFELLFQEIFSKVNITELNMMIDEIKR